MSASSLTPLFRPQVLALSAYHVADPGNLIKLDAMENPYPWPEAERDAWLAGLTACALNRYPDPAAKSLAAAVRDYYRLPAELDLMFGNGSDEIIQILLMALRPDACVMAPEPSFVMYKQIAVSLGLDYCGVPLTENFELDMPVMRAAIAAKRPALIFLAYPNNPTGNLFDADAIAEILALTPGWVVIDEAYAPFTDAHFMAQTAKHERLLLMRTVSKLGLAGLRLGFLAGAPVWLEQFNKLRLPYNINVLTQASVEYALKRGEFLAEQTRLIRTHRDALFKALQAMPEIRPYPSEANFILFKTLDRAADAVFAALKQQGVLIKNLSGQGGLLQNCLRVTVGTEAENQVFLRALPLALADAKR